LGAGILLFLLVRSPFKISEPYDNPFWDFNNGARKEKKKWNNTKFPLAPMGVCAH
jgi:hypothetical protein